jgi:hypothetical protein
MGEQFPFGAPVRSVARPPSGHRRVFVLGAYPSALHIRWTPPDGSDLRPVRALAVDNEPEPFWDGADDAELVAAWAAEWFTEEYGRLSPAGKLNGSSGRWVDDRVLRPLAARREEVWFTDCLDTYRGSRGQAKRIRDTYAPYAGQADLPQAILGEHPSETAIVRECLDGHRQRLLDELDGVTPDLVVTLGNAAARVFHELIGLDGVAPPLAREGYGEFVHVALSGRAIQWLPLVHPGAPSTWQQRHGEWVKQVAPGPADGSAKRTRERVPKWLPQQLLAAGTNAPSVLADYAADRLVGGARERAERQEATGRDVDVLVKRTIRSHVRLARSEGAVAGLTMTAAQVTTILGTAGKLTLPAAVATMGADLTALAWLQSRMVLEIAALRGDPLDDPQEVAQEFLILWGLHSPTRQVGAAASQASQRVGKRLLEKYLRGAILKSITAMFRVVGIRFSRAALVRSLPFVNIPVNAAINDVSTRRLGQKADAYFKDKWG